MKRGQCFKCIFPDNIIFILHILLHNKPEPLTKDSLYSGKITSKIDLDYVTTQVLHFLFFFQMQTNWVENQIKIATVPFSVFGKISTESQVYTSCLNVSLKQCCQVVPNTFRSDTEGKHWWRFFLR